MTPLTNIKEQRERIPSIDLAWWLLYKEVRENTPDINKPENVAYLTAMKRQRADEFKTLMDGPGKVLFKAWEKKIKDLNLSLFVIPDDVLCDCIACRLIKEIQSMFKLWMEAETIIKEDWKDGRG